jgi:3-phosphoshikimate 1-carboxyvinyltransferase
LALRTELNGLGGDVTDDADSLHINPKPLHQGTFHTYEDHRLATAGAVIGLVVEGISGRKYCNNEKNSH